MSKYTYMVQLESWQLDVISDTFHDLELDETLSNEQKEVLEVIDGYVLKIKEKQRGEIK